jgi:hypothetical protein
MKNKILFFIAFTILYLGEAKAQIGIGTNTPDASAALEIKANGSAVGLLLPRLSNTVRNINIKSPSAGLVIYNSTYKVLEVAISGSLWANLVNGTTTAVTSGSTSSSGKLGIGTTSPDANAVLDVTSTTKGVLLPKSSTDPIGVAGMIYYNTTADIVKLYNGTSWIGLIN